MILFVDNESAWGYQQPWGDMVAAWRTRITYRLEDIARDTCLLQRYPAVNPALIERLGIRAMFISGSGTDKDLYDPSAQAGLREVIAAASIPIFGFCGGYQVMMETFGAPLERIGPIDAGAEDEHPGYEPGWQKEVGYLSVEWTTKHPVQEGIGEPSVFRQHHAWEIKTVPAGFTNYAGSSTTPHQMMIHDDAPVMGTQFHPEYFTEDDHDGHTLIENFCRWSGLIE